MLRIVERSCGAIRRRPTGVQERPHGFESLYAGPTGFTASLGDTLLLDWAPETAVSQNPYIEFTFAARRSGTLRMVWTDATGVIAEAEEEIAVG